MSEFKESMNTIVITTKNIIQKEQEILLVSHDEEDGMWQFLEGDHVREEDARIVSLLEIINIDETLNEISDLPLGWIAYRDNTKDMWKRQKN